MIRLPDIILPKKTIELLAIYQEKVDSAGSYADQVAAAKRLFSARNNRNNRAFSIVRTKLNEMCGGSGRCCYCELSQPDEIEHVRPKDLFPDHVFVWENYVYSCGPCNGPKNNQFAVFTRGTRKPRVVTRAKDDAVVAPVKGDLVLIDPRTENPLDFMEIDLVDTFYFLPSSEPGTRGFERADYTIKVLRLNDRDVLIKGQRHAFVSFRAILHEYHALKNEKTDASELSSKIHAIKESPHPAVWQEMKRQRASHSGLSRLFQLVPEAVLW